MKSKIYEVYYQNNSHIDTIIDRTWTLALEFQLEYYYDTIWTKPYFYQNLVRYISYNFWSSTYEK